MAKVRQEHKDELLKRGLWAEFVLYRDEMKASGKKPAESTRMAVAKFLGEEAAKTATESNPTHAAGVVVPPRKETPPKIRVAVKRIEMPEETGLDQTKVPTGRCNGGGGTGEGDRARGEVAEGPGTLNKPPDTKASAPSASSDDRAGRSAKETGLPAGSAIDGMINAIEGELASKTAAPMEWVLWVARNIERKTPDLESCPDVGAMGLLLACKRSPVVAADFWRTFVSKAIVKSDGDKDEGRIDGAAVVDVIDRILAASERARSRGGEMGTRLAHNQESAGSSPAPATKPEAP